jgi:hypothetical protein
MWETVEVGLALGGGIVIMVIAGVVVLELLLNHIEKK